MQGWTDKLFGWQTSPSSDRKQEHLPDLDCFLFERSRAAAKGDRMWEREAE